MRWCIFCAITAPVSIWPMFISFLARFSVCMQPRIFPVTASGLRLYSALSSGMADGYGRTLGLGKGRHFISLFRLYLKVKRMLMKDKVILLVEDNPDDAVLTLRALKKNNIANEVVVAHDG